MAGKKPKQAQPELKRLLDLQAFLEQFHYIQRVVHHSADKSRLESDTEHTYVLAMTAWYLAHFFPELDKDLCIRLALAHDLVEVHAGDTYAFAAQEHLDSKADREYKALLQIEKDWPDFPDLGTTIRAYEALKTPESCFVYALDKIMPAILIFLGEGHTWHQEKLTLEQLVENKVGKVSKSPQVEHYWQELAKLLNDHPHYFPAKVSKKSS